MALIVSGQGGPALVSDGVGTQPFRQGRTAELVVQELHGRFYEQNFRNGIYSGGMSITSISNTTFTVNTLGATCTPVAGVYNPSTSPVNLVVLQATLAVAITAATNTGAGGFVWASSIANPAISTGNAPLNRKTLVKAGSYAKDMCGVALTGLTNNLVVMGASALNGGSNHNFSFVETAVGSVSGVAAAALEQIEGAWIVPPGAVLALLAMTTPAAHSAASGIVWEEVPI